MQFVILFIKFNPLMTGVRLTVRLISAEIAKNLGR